MVVNKQNTKRKKHYTIQDTNTFVLGGTEHEIYSNIILADASTGNSMVFIDHDGQFYKKHAKKWIDKGYQVWRFNTMDLYYSNGYNPLDYIYDQTGNIDTDSVTYLVNTFLTLSNTPNNQTAQDPLWERGCQALLCFVIYYVCEFLPQDQRNFYQIVKLIQLAKSNEYSSSSQTNLDKLVDAARLQNPRAKCFDYYDVYQLASARTRDAIAMSLGVRLFIFVDDTVANVTCTSYVCKRDANGLIREYCKNPEGNLVPDNSNINIYTLGRKRTVLFISFAAEESPINLLAKLLILQIQYVLNKMYMYYLNHSSGLKQWQINCNDIIVSGGYKDKQTAEMVRQLYADADIVSENNKDGTQSEYLYNMHTPKEMCMPEKLLGYKKTGFIEQILSRKAGNTLINLHMNAKIESSYQCFPVHINFYFNQDDFTLIQSSLISKTKDCNISYTLFAKELPIAKSIFNTSQISQDNQLVNQFVHEQFDATVFFSMQDKENHKQMIPWLTGRQIKKTFNENEYMISLREYNEDEYLPIDFELPEEMKLTHIVHKYIDNTIEEEIYLGSTGAEGNTYYRVLPKQMSPKHMAVEVIEERSSQIGCGIDPLDKQFNHWLERKGTPITNAADLKTALGMNIKNTDVVLTSVIQPEDKMKNDWLFEDEISRMLRTYDNLEPEQQVVINCNNDITMTDVAKFFGLENTEKITAQDLRDKLEQIIVKEAVNELSKGE